jgi:hypothetical protein
MTTAHDTGATSLSRETAHDTGATDLSRDRELRDDELDAVTGGTKAHQGKSQGSWFAAVATALGNQAAGALSR